MKRNNSALAGDYLDQPNHDGDPIISASNDYSAWAVFHQDYNRVAYGREIPDGVTGHRLLQYWIFYYYNPKQFPDGVPFAGKHEGDWEWVNVDLDAKNVPSSVSLSQHGNGEKCNWGTTVGVSDGGHPIAYVAYQSHANYFWAGTHPLTGYPFATDTTSDSGQLYREVPRVVNVSTPPNWIAMWDGRWGEQSGSPKTPGKQSGNPWSQAWNWHNNAGGCTLQPSQVRLNSESLASSLGNGQPRELAKRAIAGTAPPLPRILSARIISNTRYGKAARISYCFASLAQNPSRRPWRLHMTIENLHDGLPPLTVPWVVKKQCSVVIQPLGGIKPPYILRYRVESLRGTWSVRAQTTLR